MSSIIWCDEIVRVPQFWFRVDNWINTQLRMLNSVITYTRLTLHKHENYCDSYVRSYSLYTTQLIFILFHFIIALQHAYAYQLMYKINFKYCCTEIIIAHFDTIIDIIGYVVYNNLNYLWYNGRYPQWRHKVKMVAIVGGLCTEWSWERWRLAMITFSYILQQGRRWGIHT